MAAAVLGLRASLSGWLALELIVVQPDMRYGHHRCTSTTELTHSSIVRTPPISATVGATAVMTSKQTLRPVPVKAVPQ